MSPLDRQSLSQKLIRLDEVITELSAIAQIPKSTFLNDRRLQAATERYFILGIEIITDIGNHVLVEQTGTAGTSYENIIAELGKRKLIPPVLARRNAGMAAFRNLLVHAYEVVDARRVYHYLQKAPKEFRAFAQAFAKHLS